jgi:hypothetical protein
MPLLCPFKTEVPEIGSHVRQSASSGVCTLSEKQSVNLFCARLRPLRQKVPERLTMQDK